MLYEHVFKELSGRKVKYLVVGGIAVILHGYSRATGDLDIMISFDKANLKKFIESVKSLGLLPKAPVPLESFMDSAQRKIWVEQKNMKVFSLYNPKIPVEQIDILIDQEVPFEKAYKNRKMVSLDKIQIPLIDIPELIKLKKAAGRERDKVDIKALLKIVEIADEDKKRS